MTLMSKQIAYSLNIMGFQLMEKVLKHIRNKSKKKQIPKMRVIGKR